MTAIDLEDFRNELDKEQKALKELKQRYLDKLTLRQLKTHRKRWHDTRNKDNTHNPELYNVSKVTQNKKTIGLYNIWLVQYNKCRALWKREELTLIQGDK